VALGLCTVLVGACALGVAGSRGGREEFAAWRTAASALRGLPFRDAGLLGRWLAGRPALHLRWILPAEIGAVLRDELGRVLPMGEADGYRDAYATLGVLPREIDLLDTLLSLQEEQLVGLYSAYRRTMYVVHDPAGTGGHDPSMIVIHELVHALQHQHFPDTIRVLQALRHDDDVVTAMASALEGDASLTMMAFGAREGVGRSPAEAARVRDSMLADIAMPSGRMAEVPRLLRVSLIFPYAYGTVLAAARYAADGNAGLDALLAEPPLSTERVRFADETAPVEFLRLPLAGLAARLASRGCSVGHDNVAGALTLGVLFEEHGGDDAPEPLLRGWAGDRFLHVGCPAGPELAWVTRWDTEPAARAFAAAYARIAPSVAAAAGLAGPPRVAVDGRTAWVLSPGLESERDLLRAGLESRSYPTWRAWHAAGCFPADRCP
jgi:hypothetical protein